MNDARLPVGKLPAPLLANLLREAPAGGDEVLQGPGTGLDCAVIDLGSQLLVLKSDPITFATDEIGWYLVQVNANDIATTGAVPRWLLLTLLLPEDKTTSHTATSIFKQVYRACRAIDVAVIGGHTEITYGLDRPIAIGTLIGEVDRRRLVTPRDARVGDRLLVTKGLAIEATAILAREFSEQLIGVLSPGELVCAQDYLTSPGISILRDAQIALSAGRVSAMHDPTEGGLASALWELATASERSLVIHSERIPVTALSARVCEHFRLDPMAAISSGALLLTAASEDVGAIVQALGDEGIRCSEIGYVEDGPAAVWLDTRNDRNPLPYPERDALSGLFET